ncbi:hypothetical protein ABT369_33655 [Dactylosporangium sp. NPDC000244]
MHQRAFTRPVKARPLSVRATTVAAGLGAAHAVSSALLPRRAA